MMEMKKELFKKIFIIFLIMLIPAVFLTGCQKSEVNKQQTPQSQQITQEPIQTSNSQMEVKQTTTQTTEGQNNKDDRILNNKTSNTTNEDQELIDLLNALEKE